MVVLPRTVIKSIFFYAPYDIQWVIFLPLIRGPFIGKGLALLIQCPEHRPRNATPINSWVCPQLFEVSVALPLQIGKIAADGSITYCQNR